MDSARQLRCIDEVMSIAAELDVQVWLRGGWAMDFFLGEVTREHLDIDWFAWAADSARLTAALTSRGHRLLPGAPPQQQLDFAKDTVELSFALLARNDSGQVVVAGGPWAGEPWPKDMIGSHYGTIGSRRCPIISPAAQIEIKQLTPVWIPGRPRRAKDIADIARLQAALTQNRMLGSSE